MCLCVCICVSVCVNAYVFACICTIERFLQILIEDFPIRHFRKILLTCGLKTQLKNITIQQHCQKKKLYVI